MHVAAVTTVHNPLDARITQRQARALVDAGHAVTLVASWTAHDATPPAGVTAVDVPRAAGRRRLPALRAARHHIHRLAPEADVILVHDPELLAALAGLDYPARVWDVHEDTAAALADKPWLPPASRVLVRQTVRALERAAERRFHLLLAEATYRSRFRGDHPVVANLPRVPATPVPTGSDRVVQVGRLSWGRGVADLLDLARALPDGVELELVGAADPDVAPHLQAAHRDGLVRWHGYLPNDEALARVDGALAGVSLLRDEPNYRHSLPTKVVEYMARGVPVVTTPAPRAVELVTRHACGSVAPFADGYSAARAVAELRRNPSARGAMGERGHAAAAEHYDWNTAAVAFVDQLAAWAGSG